MALNPSNCSNLEQLALKGLTLLVTVTNNNSAVQSYLPCDDDEEVQAVPGIGEVRVLADESHRRDFDDHLNGEEDEDGVIERLKYSTASRHTRHITTRLKHSQRDAVQQDDAHADPLEPRISPTESQGITHHAAT